MTLLAGVLTASAQNFQPLNGDFEQWDGSSVTAEPSHWNSFATSDGSYAGLASTPHHYHRRNQNGQNSYLTIYTKSIMGIKANGNMTTGRIHAGAMSASSSSNYNYTQRSNSDFSQPFTATPDSMYVKVSFYASSSSSRAHVLAYVHGDNDFKDPGDDGNTSKYAAKAVAATTRTTSSASSMSWTELKVPFDYSGTATPAYLLISITTNETPGGGSANDSLSVDDIRFVYSSWLTDILVDGSSIEGFQKGLTDYDLGMKDSLTDLDVQAVTEVADATVSVDRQEFVSDTVSEDGSYDIEVVYTITVTAEDGSQRTYSVRYTTHIESDPDDPEDPEEPEDPEDPEEGIVEVEASSLCVAPTVVTNSLRILAERVEAPFALYDMGGRLLASYPAEVRTIDFSGRAAGLYLLRSGNKVARVIKK